MKKDITSIFENKKIAQKIQKKLPYLFQLAELDNSRNGKLGMEIGSTRERIITALMMSYFGEKNVDTLTPITEAETDVHVFGEPVSIKTASGKKLNGVKLIWTVDRQKVLEFAKKYKPSCDMVLAHINWGSKGGLYLLSKDIQNEILTKLGREVYIKLPKQGTNPRGVELSAVALDKLMTHSNTKKIEIDWIREDIKHNSYDVWVERWNEK